MQDIDRKYANRKGRETQRETEIKQYSERGRESEEQREMEQ